MRQHIKAMIIGHAIGDALGVPVEFKSRERLREQPVGEMTGYGSHNVPAGTWSDDTSMTLCLMESLARLGNIDYRDIMNNFLLWMNNGEFTATWTAFDIGITTRRALSAFSSGNTEALECGESGERANGNGSLMRISPLVPYLYAKNGGELTIQELDIVHNVSRLTHAHARSQMACGIYVFIAIQLLKDKDIPAAIQMGINKAYEFYSSQRDFTRELNTYSRLWDVKSFARIKEWDIKSTGYVADTLEASLWCLLNTDNYCECVLKAVNLGDDTDTVGAITGGLAGLAYGMDNIPSDWKNRLQREKYIEELCNVFLERFF